MKLKYNLLKEKDVSSTINCVVKVFLYEESMTKSLNITDLEFKFFASIICKEAVKRGLSYICKENKEIVGFCLNDEFTSTPLKELSKVTCKMNPIFKILETLDIAYLKDKKTEAKSFFHIFMVGSLPEYRKCSIAKEMVRRSIKLAKQKNFERVIVEATNLKSQNLFKNYFQFKTMQRLNYKTFKFDGEFIFRDIGEEDCELMELKLY